MKAIGFVVFHIVLKMFGGRCGPAKVVSPPVACSLREGGHFARVDRFVGAMSGTHQSPLLSKLLYTEIALGAVGCGVACLTGPIETVYGTHIIFIESCNKPENTWKMMFDDIVKKAKGEE